MERGTVEVAPLAFMRGRTLNDSFIILDEAQNTTPEQMKMFLTRLGFGSKAVVTGDVTQIDLPTGQTSGLVIVQEILPGHRGDRGRRTSAPETWFGTRSCRTSWRRTASSESSVLAPMADDDQPPLIALDDRQDAAVDLEGLIGLAQATLLGEGIADAELSISLVTEAEIAELHERYLHEAGPTDVLSFPLDEEAGEDGLRQVGDVVIAPAVAARNNPDDPAPSSGCCSYTASCTCSGTTTMDDGERAEMWARQERYSRDPRAVSGGDWFELAVVIVLIAVVAVLGAAEVSITRTNRVRAYRFQEEGRRGATSLVKIADNPAPFLNVVLLLVLLSTIGGTTIATSLAVRVFHGGGEIIATLAMTAVALRLRRGHPEDVRDPADGSRRAVPGAP